MLYAGRWRFNRSHIGRRQRICEAIDRALTGCGELLEDVRFVPAESNGLGRVVTIEVIVSWWPGDPDSLVECLYESLVSRLRPEFENQIEIEVMDTRATFGDFVPVWDDDSGGYDFVSKYDWSPGD